MDDVGEQTRLPDRRTLFTRAWRSPPRENQQEPALNDASTRAHAKDPHVDIARGEHIEQVARGETVDQETVLAKPTDSTDEPGPFIKAEDEVRRLPAKPAHERLRIPSPSLDARTGLIAEATYGCPDPVLDRMSKWTKRALPIGTGVLTAFFLRDALDNRWAEEPDSSLLISHVAATFVFAIATLCIYRVPTPSFGLLRGIELACVSAACAFMAAFQWNELREYAPRFLMSASPERDLGTFESLNDSFSLRWGFMIALYVILVPNSIKRSALVAFMMALIPIATVLAFLRHYPVSWGYTVGIAFDSFLWSAAFAGVSLYALQIIDTKLRGRPVLGNYTLLQKIGEGGMGAVWKARHRSYAQFVALKFPSDQFVGDRTAIKRFRAEVDAMAAMNHPHLVRVYNFDPGSEGRPYFVMELLDGWTLDSIIQRYGPLPASRAVYLVRQVCAALAEIHAREMVHRDVKPSNIMLCNYNIYFDFVKLLDLGIVHFPGAPRANPLHSIAGTPSYMSPEQLMPSKTLDGRSDLFAVGAVLFFLITGEALANETIVETISPDERVNRAPWHSLRDVACPKPLSEIIGKCTQKDPDDRYQSAEQLISALDDLRFDSQWNSRLAAEWWRETVPIN